MKIIKQFEDKDYYFHPRVRPTGIISDNATWFWGLGEDGNLYYRFEPCISDKWCCFETAGIPMSIVQMKKIVKEFGHLLIWL